MKMNPIPLTLLASILAFSVAEALFENQLLVNEICKKTADVKYCSEILLKNLNNHVPSNTDLMNVTVTEAYRFTANTYFYISTLLRNADDERPNLQQCAEAYAIVSFSYEDALCSFKQAYYSEIHKLNERVSGGVGICKTDFKVPGYKINPLVEKNRKTRTLVDMVNSVGDKFSS